MARNPSPRAVLSVASNNLAVTADSSNSTVHPGTIARRRYDWGDGAYKDFGATTEPHTYATAGTYSVRLTVWSNKGSSAATAQTITVSAAPTPPSSGTVLGEGDFSFLGQIDVPHQLVGELNNGQAFTIRYVNGQLRFLTMTFMGNGIDPYLQFKLVEFVMPSVGGTVTTATNEWADISNGAIKLQGCFMGIDWDETNQRLWMGRGIDYPDDAGIGLTQGLSTRTLNSNGTVSSVRGEWGISGISQRQLYGGVQAVPSWFQSTYGVGPFCAGWGGYASRGAQGVGGGTSLGPAMHFIPEPTAFPDSSNLTQTYTAMNCVTGWNPCWYPASGTPTDGDRGVRNSDVTNDFNLDWQSPAPDGLGRFVWGDSYYNTGCWIDGPTKQGFVLVGNFARGRAWYQYSQPNYDGRNFEIQVFDPADLGSAVQGSIPVWNVKPTNRWKISLDQLGSGLAGLGGNGPTGGVGGAAYDATTQRLYIYGISCLDWHNRIYVYSVNA